MAHPPICASWSLRTALPQVRVGDAQRLDGDFPVEVMPLVAEFNTVLAHDPAMGERARTMRATWPTP